MKVINGVELKTHQTSFFRNEQSIVNYSGHLWSAGRLVVTTSQGEILVGEQTGEFKFVLPDSPGEPFRIRAIVPARDKNFVIFDREGHFKYYAYTGDPRSPWVLRKDLPAGIDDGYGISGDESASE